jgi:hypothetical protein
MVEITTRLPPVTGFAASRAKLLTEVEAHGGTVDHHVHPELGPDGTEIATDVARFGAPIGSADTVVVIASGTHGVEGHGGSGLQRLVLAGGRLDTLPPGVAVVLIHAVNPYGMAWSRRVDHDNIDVNRNFIDFDEPLPDNDGYRELSPLLNPTTAEFDPADDAWQDELWAKATIIGMTETFRAVSGGQFHMPEGVQFGGNAPSWSALTLRSIWARHLTGAHAVINLDLHTGLGACGGKVIFQSADEGDAAAEVAARHFDNVLRSDRPETTDPVMVGILGPALEDHLDASTLTVPLVVEFGTHDAPTVLAAMRADNWLHQHGEPSSPLGERIGSSMRDAFYIDDETWRTQVADHGLSTIHAALDAAGDRLAG